MSRDELNRRKFHQLTAAALGGMATGALWGCQRQEQPAPAGDGEQPEAPAGSDMKPSGEDGGAMSVADQHLCRGLNDCQGLGAGGDNACRGQGSCATFEHHDCAGQNACKGQGGCGENPGQNECKGQGECAVPLMDKAWETVRARKEEQWESAGEEFSEAPPKPE